MVVRLKYKKRDIKVHRAAEVELLRFKDSNYLWAKHVCGVELDPHQLVYMQYFDTHRSCLLLGSRRIRKSFAVSVWYLKQASTRSHAECNIHSPSIEQSKRNIKYMTDITLDSQLLNSYLERRLGEGIGKEYIEFCNHSKIQAKGQASSIDGLGATHQWWEEFDDMDRETLLTRIYPTGSEIKGNFDYQGTPGCHRIATGTIKGKGNLLWLERPERGKGLGFVTLPKLDCYVGIAMGIISKEDIDNARDGMTPAQFARTYLVLYTESNDFFSTRDLNGCHHMDVFPEDWESGSSYKAQGPVTFGMDYEGQGQTEESSQTTITFVEQYAPGRYKWLYSKKWELGERPKNIIDEVVEMVRFFKPEGGLGDMYGFNLMRDINLALYRAGLIDKNVDHIENNTSGWDQWFLKPIRFHGQNKHMMFHKLHLAMQFGCFVVPVIIPDHPKYVYLEDLFFQFENIKATPTKSGYDSFSCIRKKLGDDLVDSCVAAVFAQGGEKKKTFSSFGKPIQMRGFRPINKFAIKTFKER